MRVGLVKLIPGLEEQVADEELCEIAGRAGGIDVCRIVDVGSRARRGSC